MESVIRRTGPLRIALISPKGPLYRHRGGIFRRSLRYAPLTLTTLASLIPDELNAHVRLVDEGIGEIDRDLEADLIGMTVITGTAVRSYELAARFRRRGIPVVLGGPHVTLVPEEARTHADAIVVGYAEESWPRLLRDFAAGRMRDRYDQSPALRLENLPFPRRDLLPARRYTTTNVFEATRGCVHACDFCVVPFAWGRTPLQKPVADVVADIRAHGARKAIFVDLNLIADPDYARELFTALIPLRIRWYGLATTLLGRDLPLLDLAARSGCSGLLMGLESIRAGNLRDANKRFNRPDEFAEIVRRLHERGIALQGCFVFGQDHDTPEVFEETADLCVRTGIDLPRFAIATPFPATAFYRRLESEGRILTRNWEIYDGQHVVFEPARMSVRQLQLGTEAAWKRAYGVSAIARRFRRAAGPRFLWLAANLGYRHYAYNLSRFYSCDWFTGRDRTPAPVESSAGAAL